MADAAQTRDQLLTQARALFWTRGYSNVSLREIAGAAGVDVALIARYFGSKRGLFETTLDALPELDTAQITDSVALIEAVVAIFAEAPRGGTKPSPVTMILINANDPEIGALIRERYAAAWYEPLSAILGGPERATLFSAAMLGMSVAEKTLRLDGIASTDGAERAEQLRRFLRAALAA